MEEMFKCYECGAKSVIWNNDFSFEDYGIEGEGIITFTTVPTVAL